MERKKKKINLKGLTKFSICELISFMEFNDFIKCLNISKGFRDAVIYYVDLYVIIKYPLLILFIHRTINYQKFKNELVKNFYEKNIIYTNRELYNELTANILNRNSSFKNIRKLFEEESKILNDFLIKVKNTFQKDLDNYPYPIKIDITLKEKNIMYILRKYILNILRYSLYEDIDFSYITFDSFGIKILSELIKKCEAIYFLKLNYCIFPEKGLEEILNALNSFDDFYTIELKGVKLSMNNLKHICQISKDSYKKKIIYDEHLNQNKKIKVLNNNKITKKFSEITFK